MRVWWLLLLCSMAWTPAASATVVLHVAPVATAGGDGQADRPFASLAAARDPLRERRRLGTLTEPVTVLVHGGRYELAEPFELGPEDSGTAAAPITYAAAPGDTVELSGCCRVGGWRRGPDGVWSAALPDRPGGWVFRQLFVDGRREVRARYPNVDPADPVRSGWLYVPQEQVGWGIIQAGLATRGDWLEQAVDLPVAGAWHLWVSYATVLAFDGQVRLLLDDTELPLPRLDPSGSWRATRWARLGGPTLAAGRHRLRWEHRDERRYPLHLDGLVFTTNPDLAPRGEEPPAPVAGERRVAVEGLSRTGGEARYGFQTFVTDQRHSRSKTTVVCPPGALREGWLVPGAEVEAFTAWGWFNAYLPVAGIDREANALLVGGREAAYPIEPGNRFCVANVRSELDQPGEWYFDAAARRLDYLPRGGDPNESVIEAPLVTNLVTLRGDLATGRPVEHVTLRGLTFSGTDYTIDQPALRSPLDAALLLENACRCTIEACRFVNVGGYGVRLHLASHENTIRDNEIVEAGAGGAILTAASCEYNTLVDPRPAAAGLAPLRNRIVANHLHHCGRLRKYVSGVHLDSRPDSLAREPGNLVARNLIHDLPRLGVLAFRSQGGNVIEHNRIARVMTECDDGGGIHLTLVNRETAPNVIRGNHISDVAGPTVRRDGTWAREKGFGIYLDNVSSHVLVTGNLVERTSQGALMVNGGRDLTIEHNVFVDDAANQICLFNCQGQMGDNRITHNVFAWTAPEATFASVRAWAVKENPDAVNRLSIAEPSRLATMDRNVVWHGGQPLRIRPLAGESAAGEIDSWAAWLARGMDANSVVADPRFVNAAAGDYRFDAGSPALALGIRQLDLSAVPPLSASEP